MNTTTETTADTQAAAIAEQGTDVTPIVTPKDAPATKAASRKKAAPKGQKAATSAKAPKTPKGAGKAAKGATAKAKAAKSAKKTTGAPVPLEFSKKAIVIDLLRAKGGATLAEIMKATDWQPHSVRGFISGVLGKKMGLAVESTKTDAGDRCYRITK